MNTSKKALIFGVTGQDGSYLSEWLLRKGYEVHGVMRRSSSFNTGRIDHLYVDPHDSSAKFFLHFGDLTDSNTIGKLLAKIMPDEIYNLAAQSHVRVSFDLPAYTFDVNTTGTVRLLEAVKDICPMARFYQASSSEMFGSSPPPQDENTPFVPRSPYGIAKVAAYYAAKNYRDSYGMFVCNGILFNHESPRRAETFVTRKITRAATRIKLGLQDKLYLGNLEAKRDWGFAGDYVRAMWMMLQADRPDDYVVATGKSHTVQEFLWFVFNNLGLNYANHVEIDQKYYRPSEVDSLCGSYQKIKDKLGWQPEVQFTELAMMMIDHDYRLALQELKLKN